MALYYHLVFGLLVVEMAFFTVLSLPFPRAIRRKVLTTFSAPFRNEQFQMGLKCVLGFVLVLFIDSMNRVYTVTQELEQFSSTAAAPSNIVTDRSDIQARKFYAQRNMYLCGFTLFLTLILSRTYSLVVELIVTKDKLDNFKANGKLSKGANTDSAETAELRKRLASKEEDLSILQNQAKSLSEDYNSVSTGSEKL